MSWRALTLAGEYGSGASAIADIIAKRLRWRLLDGDNLLAEISRRADVPIAEAAALDECVDPWLHRVTKPLWGKGGDGISPISAINLFDGEEAAALSARIILDAYEAGPCVIVGRGAQCVLHGKLGVFHAFAYAGFSERVRRVRERASSTTNVENQIHQADQRRVDFLRHYYGVDRLNPHLYDMLINSHSRPETAALLILEAMRVRIHPDLRQTEGNELSPRYAQRSELSFDLLQRLLLPYSGGFSGAAAMGDPDADHGFRLEVIPGVEEDGGVERHHLD